MLKVLWLIDYISKNALMNDCKNINFKTPYYKPVFIKS